MFRHFIKVAFRNLFKFKVQSLISILGLAIGFACFSLSMFWVQYERSYDNFHPEADRIYRVREIDNRWNTDSTGIVLSPWTAYPLAEFLRSNFPEIISACQVESYAMPLKSGKEIDYLVVDTAFCTLFDIPANNFFTAHINNITPVIITERLAKELFGNTDVTGMTIENIWNQKFEIRSVIREWPGNTSYPFDMLIPAEIWYSSNRLSWGYLSFHTYVLLHPRANANEVQKKMTDLKTREHRPNSSFALTPIKEQHYKSPDEGEEQNVKYSHISIFAISGLLIMLCALFNYLTLFVSRIISRGKELALRKVNGSANAQVFSLLFMEFMLILLFSILAGYLLIGIFLPSFRALSMIQMNSFMILSGTLLYVLALVAVTSIIGIIPIGYFYRRNLREMMQGQTATFSRNRVRKISILLQLIIGIGFMFCAVVFFRQIHFLTHTDMGIERKNIAEVSATRWSTLKVLPYFDKIRQIPTVNDVLKTSYPGFIERKSSSSKNSSVIKNGKEFEVNFMSMYCEPHFFDFYHIQLSEGTLFTEDNAHTAVINETAARQLGEDPQVKEEVYQDERIIGVVKDFYFESPTTKIKPTIIYPLHIKNGLDSRQQLSFVYKYEEGTRKETEDAVRRMIQEDHPGEELEFRYSEDVYEKYLKSEKSLMIMLGFMTFVCIMIAIFGIYSLASLTCEQRKKEIAIRKVNGAMVHDILLSLFREYAVLIVIASLIAFPAGYLIVKPWTEGYIKQVSIDWWIYALIFIIVCVITLLTVISQVWKAARQNPAEVVKSE
ncbi:MAG: ABC transporter permease [Bacteroidales bacterium]|jgi:ABC-type antimicrobial peptide transport system permease subunit|nr:ABC transporter permease [Bacteroidales bacterium]